MGDETETVLLHLGYVSSYDSYLFCVLMTSDPDLACIKISIKFPIDGKARLCKYEDAEKELLLQW